MNLQKEKKKAESISVCSTNSSFIYTNASTEHSRTTLSLIALKGWSSSSASDVLRDMTELVEPAALDSALDWDE
jgi:hypothetical protein